MTKTGKTSLIGKAILVLAGTLLATLLCSCSAAQQSDSKTATDALDAQAVRDAPFTQPEHPDAQYVLVIGDDSWGAYTPGRADLMMLMRLDFERNQISLVTVPRDTKYVAPDGGVSKLNQVYCDQGPEAQCAAVSSVAGVDVTQYVAIGFEGLQGIVEHFGDLNVSLPYALDYSFYTKDYPNEQFAEGEQTLTPWRAMALSRTRTSYGDYNLEQDMMRQVVDRQMMVNLIQLAFADPSQTKTLLGALQGFVATNVSLETQSLWADELVDGSQITVHATSGPYAGGIDEETQLWLVTPDPENWKALMDAVDAGRDPAQATAAYAAASESPRAPVSTSATIALS